jgi:hypothetical protein
VSEASSRVEDVVVAHGVHLGEVEPPAAVAGGGVGLAGVVQLGLVLEDDGIVADAAHFEFFAGLIGFGGVVASLRIAEDGDLALVGEVAELVDVDTPGDGGQARHGEAGGRRHRPRRGRGRLAHGQQTRSAQGKHSQDNTAAKV